jgi:hypothetical protein
MGGSFSSILGEAKPPRTRKRAVNATASQAFDRDTLSRIMMMAKSGFVEPFKKGTTKPEQSLIARGSGI